MACPVRLRPALIACIVFVFGNALTYALPLSQTLLVRDKVECVPASAIDVVSFFLVNFGTHVASIKPYPGTEFYTTIKWAVAAFLLPYSGILRGCVAIARGRKPGETQLQQAARSGALAQIIRGRDWRPEPGESISNVGFRTEGRSVINEARFYLRQEDQDRLDILSQKENVFHGQIDPRLAEHGYELAHVKVWQDVEPFHEGIGIKLGNEPSWAKAVAAIVQLVSACYTLYQTRGSQIESYGYAAFGLCVIPYATMSLINLFAAFVNADYPAIYLVQTPVMKEAMNRGLRFSGMVGQIKQSRKHGLYKIKVRDVNKRTCFVSFDPIELVKTTDDLDHHHPHHQKEDDSTRQTHDSTYSRLLPDHDGYVRDPSDPDEAPVDLEIACDNLLRTRWTPSRHSNKLIRWVQNFSARHWIALLVGLAGLVTPYVLIAVLTRGFQRGSSSTAAQRGWTLAWLVSGSVLGLLVGLALQVTTDTKWALLRRAVPIFVVVATPAIGGCVVVAREILQFGSCTSVG